jgi:hypothetical protein
MKKSSKDLIIKAHDSASSEWKTRFEKEFPKLFENKVVFGKGYKSTGKSIFLHLENGNVGFNVIGNWTDKFAETNIKSWTPATDEEIKQAFIKEANKRGFKMGVEFIDVFSLDKEIVDGHIYRYYPDGNVLTLNHDHIFINGKWAEIIEEPEINMSRFKQLNERVCKWANDKGILDLATPLTQLDKTEEEVAELREALFAQSNNMQTYIDSKGRTEDTASSIKFELAGSLVTLIVQAKLQNIDILNCLEMEITKIEQRNGKMINGSFVKNNI